MLRDGIYKALLQMDGTNRAMGGRDEMYIVIFETDGVLTEM